MGGLVRDVDGWKCPQHQGVKVLCPGPLPSLLSSFVGPQWCVIWVNVILPFPAEGLLESIDPCCWACFTECDNVPGVCDLRTV